MDFKSYVERLKSDVQEICARCKLPCTIKKEEKQDEDE